MQSLREYLSPLSPSEREAFAVACLTTWTHLRNCMYGTRTPSPALAMQIELQSGGRVPRSRTRPGDAHLIWPAEFAPDQATAAVLRATGEACDAA